MVSSSEQPNGFIITLSPSRRRHHHMAFLTHTPQCRPDNVAGRPWRSMSTQHEPMPVVKSPLTVATTKVACMRQTASRSQLCIAC
jgi:hypothetical protein